MDGISSILGRKLDQYRASDVGRNLPYPTPTTQKSSNSGVPQKKKLNYNFKELSRQIMRAKTSVAAKPVVTKIRKKIAELKKKLGSDEYDEDEIRDAIAHAQAMMRIAEKRVKNLRQEELASRGVQPIEETEEQEKAEEALSEETLSASEGAEELPELSAKMQEMTEELSDEMAEELSAMLEEMSDAEMEMMRDMSDELDQLFDAPELDLAPEDLEDLKRKHRNQEMKEITRADMKYLRSMFERYENAKAGGNIGVSLSIGGSNVAVPAAISVVSDSGGSVDVQA